MNTEKNIFIAFILNLIFSVIEFAGGILTGSVAIVSDAVHDIGDATSIGISYLLEKKSKRQPDENYTYGYTRYSVIGSVVTTLILLLGSIIVIYNAITRLVFPVQINYSGMIVLAVIGVFVNLTAAIITHKGTSLNQKAVNLHMLEDVLGWIVVLVGAIVMKFTDFAIIDSFMSIGVAVFILVNAVKNLKEALDLFLEKPPDNISVDEIKNCVKDIDGVIDIHHIHIWSMDGQNNYATMHIVTNEDFHVIKEKIRDELREHRIGHATLELETENEHCHEKICNTKIEVSHGHHH